MNILLIDDESIVTDSIKESLTNQFVPNRKYGRALKIDVANDFFAARKFLDSNDIQYHLIISDLLLPRRGGLIPDSYKGSALTGWFFLYCHILKVGGIYHTKYEGTKIILFSAYRAVWDQYMADNQTEMSGFQDKVITISKEDESGSNSALIDKLKEIFG